MVGVSPCAYPLTHSAAGQFPVLTLAAGQSQGIAPTKYQKKYLSITLLSAISDVMQFCLSESGR